MDGFKRFSTLGRLLTSRSRATQEIPHRKKYLQTYSALSRDSNLIRKPKKFQNNFPLFKSYELQPVSNHGRRYSDVIDRERHMISTFDVYYNPFPVFDILLSNIKSLLINILVDKNFDPKEFIQSSEVALRVVSKLIAENRLSELEDLVTPECLSKLQENTDNWVPINRGDLEVVEKDFLSSAVYRLEIIPEESRRGIQASVFFFVIKGLVQDIGDPTKTDNINEFLQKMGTAMQAEKRKTYGANYRFIKWLHDGKSSDWIINGINHFRIINEYETKTD